MERHYLESGAEINYFRPTDCAASSSPPCLVFIAGTGWFGGWTRPVWYPLNRMIARRAAARGYDVALVFCRHRCARHTCALEFLAALVALAAPRWRGACLAVLGLGLAFSARRRAAPASGEDFDRAVEDAGAALRWARDRQKPSADVAFGGYSCGAHVALLCCLRSDDPPSMCVLISGTYDVGDAFDDAWEKDVGFGDALCRNRFLRFFARSLMDDVLGAYTPFERRRASLPRGGARLYAALRRTRWRIADCEAELGGFRPFQEAFFDAGLARLVNALDAARAGHVRRTLAGNHWTLPRHLDEAFAALLPPPA